MGIGEAPTDGQVYARRGSTVSWLPALPLTGGTLSGAVTFNVSPVAPTPTAGDSSTKLATTAFIGAAIAAIPAPGPAGAYAIVASTPPNASAPVVAPPMGLLFADTSVPDPTTAYLQTTGGTLTGPLTLAADPTIPLGAATKQYADKMLPLAGGTLSGPLTTSSFITVNGGNGVLIDQAAGAPHQITGRSAGSNRWAVQLGDGTAEGGSNAGANLAIVRYADAGTVIDAPLTINRATGAVALAGGSLTLNSTTSNGIYLNKPASGLNNFIFGQTAGLLRWQLNLGNGTAEGGSNAGSDLSIARYTDAGTVIDTPLTISRATGVTTLSQALTIAPVSSGAFLTLNKPTANQNLITGQTGGLNRWVMTLGNADAGGNAGADFSLTRFNDAGTLIDAPLSINRASGAATFSQPVTIAAGGGLSIDTPTATVRQITARTGGLARWQMILANATAEGGAQAGSDFVLNAWNDAGNSIMATVPLSIKRSTSVATFGAAIVNGPSDRSLKQNIAPLENSLDKVCKLQGVSFAFKATPDKPEIGLIAQDVQPIVPEVIQPFQNGEDEGKLAIDYPRLVAHLVEAIKTLTARMEMLEARP